LSNASDDDHGQAKQPRPIGLSEDAKPKSTEKQYSSDKRKHTWLEKFAVFFAGLAFVAALWQEWVARDTEKRQLRAYVSIKAVGEMTFVPGVVPHSDLMIKNFGSTPAIKVKQRSTIEKMSYPLLGNLHMADTPTLDGDSTLTIFPTEEFPATTRSKIPFTKDEIDAISNGVDSGHRFYIFANLTYIDIFGKPHWTHFCGMYGPASPKITYCDQYNDTDDD
jgi:hypothetical protein